MPADNHIYETLPDWWDPAGSVAGLHAMNPARAGYAEDAIRRHTGLALSGLRLLDLGCGGGILSETLARAGAGVVGLDLALGALQTARDHAAAPAGHVEPAVLAVHYLQADALRLPFADAVFPAVVASDLLEHVTDLDAVVAEIARVLRPGGAFVYDTINRTWLTRLFHIGVVQEWRKLVPPRTHDFAQFVRPAELDRALGKAGLKPVERRGLIPRHPLRFALRLLVHRRGRDRMGEFRIADWTAGSFIGTAVKPRA